MDSTSRADSTELAEYAAMLRRRWWVVVAGALLGLAIAVAGLFLLPKSYVSTAVVQVSPTDPEQRQNNNNKSDISLETEAQRLRSTEVTSLVQKRIGSGESPLDLGRRVQVNVPPNSSVLVIDWAAPSAAKARAGAQAFAEAYLQNRNDKTVQRLQTQAAALEKQISDVRTKLATAGATQRRVLAGQMTAFSNKLTDIQVAMANVDGGEIITSASPPPGPASPDPVKFLPSGLAGGLLLGIVLAILYDRIDRRVRVAGDVERVLDLPVLLSIPQRRGKEGLGLLPARSRSGQNFHELAHEMTATLGHGNHVILVTGAAPGPGSSIVSVNLAAALARTGSNVLLVCANLQSPLASDLLGLHRGAGLSELLLGRVELRDVVRRNHALPSLATITPGADADLAAEMLQREQMARLIGSLREKARFTVIEAPSTELGADAQALADLSDAALIVVETPRTRYAQIRDGVRRIHRMGAAVLGAVVLPRQDETAVAAPPPTLPREPRDMPPRRRDGSAGPAAPPLSPPASPPGSKEPRRAAAPAAREPGPRRDPLGEPEGQRQRKHARPPAPDASEGGGQDKPNDKTITLGAINLDAFASPDEDAVSPAADTLTDKTAKKLNRP
ncbi:Wzz/FepE/Etk N-terminal domain-containing protein [Spirillospora sp. CA-128828]|uniref:Wzz/FepE/Etk N-terminal domain-containing protein n=1 Tax=Spirillospora sp. CA-128828 TaxID=3240033 RepID=UPI003D8AE27C